MNDRYCLAHDHNGVPFTIHPGEDECASLDAWPCVAAVLVPVTQWDAVQPLLDLLAEPWVASALDFLRDRFHARRCDSDGVADCERCSVMALVNVLTRKAAALGIPVDTEAGNGA